MNLVYTNLFQVDCETSSTAYINHSRHLILDGIHRHEGMREEKPVFPFWCWVPSNGGTGTIFYIFGMTRPGFEPATSCIRSGCSTTWLLRQLNEFR